MITHLNLSRLAVVFLLLFSAFYAKANRDSWQSEVNQIEKDYGVRVIFDGVEFPSYWASSNPKWTPVMSTLRASSLKRLRIDLSHYDEQFLQRNLSKIYLFSDLSFNNQVYGGTNDHINKWLYLHVNWLGDQGLYEEAMGFHHEFSSLLFKNHKKNFSESKWKALNPSDFDYRFEQSSSENLGTGKVALIGSRKLNRKGFICSYGTLTLEDDINTFAQLLIAKPDILQIRMVGNPKLKKKAELLKYFFSEIGLDINR